MRPDTVAISAEGVNHARLLSELMGAEVRVYGFYRRSQRVFGFSVAKKDLRKTFAILDDMCYTYSADASSSYSRIGKSMLARLGFIVALAVCITLIALSRNYVWRIKISGNQTVPDKVIENVLAEHNISVGKNLKNFDGEKISAALRATDGIKLASAELRGTTVCVEVFESEDIAPPLVFSESDITSGYDATVTRIVTRDGTALVRPGQNVFAGAPLIGAYRLDEEGNRVPGKASGTVYGKVAFTESRTVATEWYERVPIGSYKRTRLCIFGLTIGKKLPNGVGYEISESSEKLSVFLPVTVKHARVTRTEMRKMSAGIDELAAKTEDEVVSSFINANVTSGFEVSRTVNELGGGLYRVNVFIQAEIAIGKV